MNQNIKNGLGGGIILALLAFMYASITYVNAYVRNTEPASFRSFSASAQGKVVAVPDVAQFTFSVITEGGKDISTLQEENTDKMNKAIDFLKKNGIKEDDIQTQAYEITPRYTYFPCNYDSGQPCPPPDITGYSVHQTVLVKIREFEKMGDVISGAVENGANNVSQLSFTIDDRTELENQAREKAIQKAKDKAEAIADAGGFRIGRLLSIEESGSGIPPMPYPYAVRSLEAGFDTKADAAFAPEIQPGSQDIFVEVTLRYEIQ